MGAGQSAQSSSVASNDALLARLGGAEAIDFADAFWSQLLTLQSPLASEDPALVQEQLVPHFRQLMVHNPLTHNFQRLVLHTLDLLSAAQGGKPSLAVANALHLLALVLKYMIETGSPSGLTVSFDVTPGLPASVQGQPSLLPLTINRLVMLLCNLQQPSEPMAHLVLLEALLLLLVCASTQLHVQQTAAPLGTHPLLEALMAQPECAAPLVTGLLQLVVSRPPLPPGLQLYAPPEGGTSVMRLVRTAAATVLWIPLRTFQYIVRSGGAGSGAPGGGSSGAPSPLGDLALSVLLVLAHYPAHHAQLRNGVRDGLAALQDTSGQPDAEGGHAAARGAQQTQQQKQQPGGGSNPTASFARLYGFFASGPHSEASTLLLYTLLHGSRSFQEYVLVRSDPETLLLPLLQQLYEANKARANHLYMLQIIILMLSQDTSFSHNIHKVSLPGAVAWYKERVLTRISLGSLVYVVLLRTAHKNIGQVQDLLLPTNALAALANLAPQVTGMHSHAAQRLVGLTSSLGRRWLKLSQALAADALAQPPPEVQVLGDFLRILLEVANAVLSLNLLRNPELVYALLHRQEVFGALRQAGGFGELLDNLQAVIDFFNKQLDAEPVGPPQHQQHQQQLLPQVQGPAAGAGAGAAQGHDTWSVQHVLSRVQAISQRWRGDGMRHLPEMRFVYEEEEAPEEFFVPYSQSLAITQTGGRLLTWNLGAATLLTQLSGIDVSGDGEGGGSGGGGGSGDGGNLEHRLSDPFHGSGEFNV